MLIRSKSLKISLKEIIRLLATGVLVAFHWFLFYYSIKISTASVALVCLSAITLFTSILEPLINRRKFLLLDFIIGIIIISGILLIFKFESKFEKGIIIGLSAAFVASLFTVFNSRFVQRTNALTISLFEMLGGLISLSLYLLLTQSYTIYTLQLNSSDLIYLLILSTVCTAMTYVLAVSVMKTLSAITVVLTTNLEPVYGIVLAFIILGKKEQMQFGFYAGGTIILLAVFTYPLLKKRFLKTGAYAIDLESEKKTFL